MRRFLLSPQLAGLSLSVGLSLAGCTAKEDVAPDNTGCNELVTVRFCRSYGDAPNCAAIHTTLQLANSYYVAPAGAVWEAYQAHQVDGQLLRVGYQLGPQLPPNVDGLRTATITCLAVADWCGTPSPSGN